jgi:group II intron reverse transcriptase/maturase
LSSETVSTKLQQIAEQAKRYPRRVFTTLAHHIDEDFLREAYRRTNKSSSPGVDGVTAKQYAENLQDNLQVLHERLRNGRYKAPPVERVWLEKEGGKKRPIGKPAFEDKIVQRAVVMLLGAIYEQDFYDFTHGFRPGRRPHRALKELRQQCVEMRIGWIVDADVSSFFDSIDRGWLRKAIQQRVNDGSLLRLIGKWLNAGVMDQGVWSHPERGTPQGGVISPMLANIFLHHVLDDWFVKVVRPRMKGQCFLIRFADDFVIGCTVESDARRIMKALTKRFGRFGLTIHPEKSKLISFGKPPRDDTRGHGGRGTFDFLGFTHYWARSRRGYWVIKRKTARNRQRRAQKALWEWCRRNRHLPIPEQHQQLCLKLKGHFLYYYVRGNYRPMERLRRFAEKAWRFWLSRRSQRGSINWEKFGRLLKVFPLPKPERVSWI